jgi:hypothetical protein
MLISCQSFAQFLPPGWNTPEYGWWTFAAASVHVPSDTNQVTFGRVVVYDNIEQKDYTLLPGDWIGFFCQDGKCAGAGQVIDTTVNLGITLVADNLDTEEKEGFAENEFMQLVIHRYSLHRDIFSTFTSYVTPSEDSTINEFYDWDGYFNNGFLYVIDTIIAEVSLEQQTVFLNEGWNGLSSYLAPINPDINFMFGYLCPTLAIPKGTKEPNLEDFNTRDLVILMSMYQVFWPEYGVNTIGYWQPENGYMIKLTESTEYVFKGLPEIDNTLELSQGWHLIPVLSKDNYLLSDTLTGGQTDLIKSFDGKVYWPYYGIYTLQELKSGSAYKIHLENNFTLDYGLTGSPLIIPEIPKPAKSMNYIYDYLGRRVK